MALQPVYKHTIQVEVLTGSPENFDGMSLRAIGEEIINGDWSGTWTVTEGNVQLTGKAAVDAIREQGSDPEFFGMDEEGNEI
jgi:hypothetical protein